MRYLTKSRFKLVEECPAKLFYTRKPEYPDKKLEDPFLAALAEGGFQVGELAKCYFPGGTDIKTLDYKESLEQTNQLLLDENAVIYEAAVRFKNLFIRVDNQWHLTAETREKTKSRIIGSVIFVTDEKEKSSFEFLQQDGWIGMKSDKTKVGYKLKKGKQVLQVMGKL